MARCGSTAAGFGGHLVVSEIVANVAHYSIGVADRLLILVPVFLVAHVPSWRCAWSSRHEHTRKPDDTRAADQELASLLHDTVGQRLTIIAMQARSATAADDARELHVIGEAATRAMAELREVLGSLHESPKRLEDIFEDCLVDVVNWFRAAGVAVNFVSYGSEDHVPSPLRSVLVRVVREAVSNAVKHEHNAQVVVELYVTPRPRLLVRTRSGSVAGEVPAHAAARPVSAGHGTRMMHRLVAGQGGSLRTGRCNGEFSVEAVFPAAGKDLVGETGGGIPWLTPSGCLS